jgi:hypothetical protein
VLSSPLVIPGMISRKMGRILVIDKKEIKQQRFLID